MQRSAEKQKLITDNLGLAYKVAISCIRQGFFSPEEYDDLVQVASIGLIHAADAFDPSRGLKFSTLACKACRNEILKIPQLEKMKKRKPTGALISMDRLTEMGTPIANFVPAEDRTDDEALALRREDVVRAIQGTPGLRARERRRAILKLDGWSYPEIARIEGVSPQAVQPSVRSAMRKIKKRIKEYI